MLRKNETVSAEQEADGQDEEKGQGVITGPVEKGKGFFRGLCRQKTSGWKKETIDSGQDETCRVDPAGIFR